MKLEPGIGGCRIGAIGALLFFVGSAELSRAEEELWKNCSTPTTDYVLQVPGSLVSLKTPGVSGRTYQTADGEFNADFTGTLIDASGPVAVHVGSEASDAPFFGTLASRSCCADHLEEQAIPLRAAGKRYVLCGCMQEARKRAS